MSLATCTLSSHNPFEAKGHPLYWTVMEPDWLPDDYKDMKPYLTRRLREIAKRYDVIIKKF